MTTLRPKTAVITAKAPAKIILSGEHSVVYGADAIAVAVQKYTQVSFTPSPNSNAIETSFAGLPKSVSYPLVELKHLKHTLDKRFNAYHQGSLPIEQILEAPNDLAIYALTAFIEQFSVDTAPVAGTLQSQSNIPMGAGMGSSASAIVAITLLYERMLQKPLTLNQRCELVRYCERLQHGKGSAIDSATVTFGGVNHIHQGHHQTTDLRLDQDWYWLYTGKPQSSTGQCVSHVRSHYGNNNQLWDDFNTVTNQLISDLHHNASPLATIQHNQQLLNTIGVVSTTANNVINIIEQHGGGAKVSGAGTVHGEDNGLLLAYLPKNKFSFDDIQRLIDTINHKHDNYIKQWDTLLVDHQGAMILS